MYKKKDKERMEMEMTVEIQASDGRVACIDQPVRSLKEGGVKQVAGASMWWPLGYLGLIGAA